MRAWTRLQTRIALDHKRIITWDSQRTTRRYSSNFIIADLRSYHQLNSPEQSLQPSRAFNLPLQSCFTFTTTSLGVLSHYSYNWNVSHTHHPQTGSPHLCRDIPRHRCCNHCRDCLTSLLHDLRIHHAVSLSQSYAFMSRRVQSFVACSSSISITPA